MRGFVLICIGVFSIFGLNAQDALYRITISSPLSINPAFAGSSIKRNLTYNRILLGNQHDYSQTRRNTSFSYDGFHSKLGGAIGFYANYQSFNSHDIQLYSTNAIYNYILPISKRLFIKTAVQIGLESKKLDAFSRGRFLESPYYLKNIDPTIHNGVYFRNDVHWNRTYMTIGSGVIAQWHQLEIGFSAFNINRPNWSFIKEETHRKPVHYNVHGKHPIYKHKKYHIIAKAFYSHQNNEKYFVAGSQLKSQRLMFGIFYNDYKNSINQYHFGSASIGYTVNFIQLRIGVEQNLNKTIQYNQFNTTFSVSYIFVKKINHGCGYSSFGEHYPDNTF